MSKLFSTARLLAATLALLTVLGAFAPLSLAANCPAGGSVKNAGLAFMAAARRGTASAFASALGRHTDVRAAAIFALGQYRSALPAGRQGEYLKDAQAYMAQFLLRHAKPFRSSRDLKIETCKGSLVETSLDGRSRMVWRASGSRIRDVRVSGVWLSIAMRSKFTGIIRRNNGNVDALLDFLRVSGR